MQVYRKGKTECIHGVEFHVQGPCQCKDGRWKSTVYMKDPRPGHQYALSGQPRSLEMCQVIAQSRTKTQQKTQDTILSLFDVNAEKMLSWMADGQYSTATMDLYWFLRSNEIRQKRRWAGQSNMYDELWCNRLSAFIGVKRISDMVNLEELTELMDNITKYSSKKFYSVEDRMCWIVLDDILWMMVLDGIISHNPIADLAAMHLRKLSQDVLADLRRNSMALTESISMLAECLKLMNTKPIFVAITLRLLTGMTISELCALNCGDWRAGTLATWIEITKVYKQVRGKAPELTSILDSYNAYRCIPCSDVVERLLAMHLTAHKLKDPSAPLFIDSAGNRITPDMIKKAEATLKQSHIVVESPLRASKRGKHFDGVLAWSDTLRGNVAYHFKYNTDLEPSESSYILGVRRQTTNGEWYVDWCSEPVLFQLKAKINHWHNMMIAAASSRPGIRKNGLHLSGYAPKGSHIMINNTCGIAGSIYGG